MWGYLAWLVLFVFIFSFVIVAIDYGNQLGQSFAPAGRRYKPKMTKRS
jgi:hypothetical protein